MREERAKRRIEAVLAAFMPLVSRTRRIVVLCYHSVHPWSPIRSATPAGFEQQIAWLQEHCEIVPFKSIHHLGLGHAGRRPIVAITFDDGYEDNHRYALPILQAYGAAATIFVTSGLADQDRRVIEQFARSWGVTPDHVQGLTWSQIAEMRSTGLEIGAHTRTHPVLSRLDEVDARDEIEGSRAAIEDRLGEAVSTLAYPFGKPREHVSDQIRRLVAELGFESAAAILYRGVRDDEDPMSIPRFPITRDAMEIFSGKVLGRLDAIGMWQSYAPRPLSRLISTDPTKETLHNEPAGSVPDPPSDRPDRDNALDLAPRWVALPWSRSPRWLVPRSPPAHARAGVSLDQPVTLRGRMGWEAASTLAEAGAFRHLRSYQMMPREAWEAAAPFIPRGGGVAIGKASRPGRFKALVLDAEGQPLVFIKVARDTFGARALMTEHEALQGYGAYVPSPLFAPEVVSYSDGVLVLRALDWRPRTSPWRLPEEVAFAIGVFFSNTFSGSSGLGAAHGDFVPRNLLQIEGGWGLADWGSFQRESPPYSDLLQYIIQSHEDLGRPTLQTVLDGLQGEGWVGDVIAAYAAGAGVDTRDCAPFLLEHLRIRASKANGESPRHLARLRAAFASRLGMNGE